MKHIAIMKKSWGLREKILTGEKTAESRWYKTRRAPWNKIKTGDSIYFKNSGEEIKLKARVAKVIQFENLNSTKRKEILMKYGKSDLGVGDIMPEIKKYSSNKNYCILIFLNKIKRIKPFDIKKTGFGAMSAWIVVDDIDKIKK